MRKYHWNAIKALEFMSFRVPELEIRKVFVHQLNEYEKYLIKCGLGPETSTWTELFDKTTINFENEELLLVNTYLNGKENNEVINEGKRITRKNVKVKWVDEEIKKPLTVIIRDKLEDENDEKSQRIKFLIKGKQVHGPYGKTNSRNNKVKLISQKTARDNEERSKALLLSFNPSKSKDKLKEIVGEERKFLMTQEFEKHNFIKSYRKDERNSDINIGHGIIKKIIETKKINNLNKKAPGSASRRLVKLHEHHPTPLLNFVEDPLKHSEKHERHLSSGLSLKKSNILPKEINIIPGQSNRKSILIEKRLRNPYQAKHRNNRLIKHEKFLHYREKSFDQLQTAIKLMQRSEREKLKQRRSASTGICCRTVNVDNIIKVIDKTMHKHRMRHLRNAQAVTVTKTYPAILLKNNKVN